jgi:hypothetical protein
MNDNTPDAGPSRPRKDGFIILPKGLLDLWPMLPEHHKHVLPVVLDHAPGYTPTQGKLAARLNRSRQRINATIGEMIHAGLLTRTHKGYELTDLDNDAEVFERAMAWYSELPACTGNAADDEGADDAPVAIEQPTAAALATPIIQSAAGPSADAPAEPQDAPQAQDEPRHAKPKKSKQDNSEAKMTDTERATILDSRLYLAGQLAFGWTAGVMPLIRHRVEKKTATGTWQHLDSPTCWFDPEAAATAPDTDAKWKVMWTPRPDATKLALASYAWFAMSEVRRAAGLPLSLPGSNDLMGRRGTPGILRDLYERLGADATGRHIQAVTFNWNEIVTHHCGWMAKQGRPLVPDTGMFANRAVIKAVEQITLAPTLTTDDNDYDYDDYGECR